MWGLPEMGILVHLNGIPLHYGFSAEAASIYGPTEQQDTGWIQTWFTPMWMSLDDLLAQFFLCRFQRKAQVGSGEKNPIYGLP